MKQPLTLTTESGSVTFSHLPAGGISLEAKGALAPTIAAIDFSASETAEIRAWLGKVDAATRAEAARLATAPNSQKTKRA